MSCFVHTAEGQNNIAGCEVGRGDDLANMLSVAAATSRGVGAVKRRQELEDTILYSM